MKEGDTIGEKKQLNTPVDADIFEAFKAECKKYGIGMNTALEGLMKDFIENSYTVTIVKTKGTTKVSLSREE